MSKTAASLLTLWLIAAAADGSDPAAIPDLRLFLISTDFGPQAIATCNTQTCYDLHNTEDADLSAMYCDTGAEGGVEGAVGYAPHGCVRWWEDQSGFDCAPAGSYPGGRPETKVCRRQGHPHEDEWVAGHEFGQDDREKPAFVPDCINGLPCARGFNVGGLFAGAQEPAGLETQSYDVIRLSGDFSQFLLWRPVAQPRDYGVYGSATSQVRVRVSDLSLVYKPRGGLTYSLGVRKSVRNGEWQLLEIHRDPGGSLQAVVDGVDVTSRPVQNQDDFALRYFITNYVNRGGIGSEGDFAAFLLYDRSLDEEERQTIRDYLDSIYAYRRGRGEADPAQRSEVWIRAWENRIPAR